MTSIGELDAWLTAMDVCMAEQEAAQTSAQALPVESERQRNGRLLFEANSSLMMHNFPEWETQPPVLQEEYCKFADLFMKAAGFVSFAQVRSDITTLHEGSMEDNDDFACGWREACHTMSNVITRRYGKETE